MYNSVEDYFRWLLGIICFEERPIYWKVLELLFERPFYSKIYMDDNRAADGLELRYRFITENGGATLFMMSTCSVLEMMVALADRIEFDNLHDPIYGNRTHIWFWEMLDNLGLSDFDDGNFDENFVQNKVDIFLERRYCRNGSGGLFTIRNPRIDMRREELWCQAQYFIEEKYD